MAFKKNSIQEDETKDELFEEVKKKPAKMSATKKTTIAVASAMKHIGATTQALHIADYLRSKADKKVAYVEMNDHQFLKMLEKTYEDVRKDRNGNYLYDGLTMVSRDNLQSVSGEDYDYLVYDYGAVTDDNFPLMFEERNIQILVGGTSPEEMLRTTEALSKKQFSNVKVIFSFCPKGDQDGILHIMAGWADRTFFAKYSPDMLHGQENMDDIYSQIIPEEDE